MKTLVALAVLAASVTAASAEVTPHDISRFATPNQLAQLSDDERVVFEGLVYSGKSDMEIRNFIKTSIN